MSDVEDRIAEIIVNILQVERDGITPSLRFQEDLKADSQEVVELVLSVEDELIIKIPDDKIETIRTVGDLIAFVKAEQHV